MQQKAKREVESCLVLCGEGHRFLREVLIDDDTFTLNFSPYFHFDPFIFPNEILFVSVVVYLILTQREKNIPLSYTRAICRLCNFKNNVSMVMP